MEFASLNPYALSPEVSAAARRGAYMETVVAMLVIGFLAALAWFLAGKRGQKEVWLIAGALAFLVGLGINFAKAAPRTEQRTKTYEQCHPDIGRGTMVCTTIPYSTSEVVYPKGDPFLKAFGLTILETPAGIIGILAGISVARLVGAKGEAPPRELENPFE
jgi:hypothetical protein